MISFSEFTQTAPAFDPILEKIAQTTIFSYEQISDAYSVLGNYELVQLACNLSIATQLPLVIKYKTPTKWYDTCNMILAALMGVK